MFLYCIGVLSNFKEGGFMQSQNPSMFDVQSVDLSLGKDILR
tara:strand:- start:388 stop:513 length:126 start_codon:yes stop_codon:yes gene_type:complete